MIYRKKKKRLIKLKKLNKKQTKSNKIYKNQKEFFLTIIKMIDRIRIF